MKRILCLAAWLAGTLAGQTAASQPGGWIKLFDGRSLNGWTPEQGAKWRVSRGKIVGDAGTDGWLRSNREFSDFALKIDFKNTPKGNSGVFLRSTLASNKEDPSNPSGSYELQINNEDDKWATGSIENFIQRLTPVNPTPNQWHSYEVEVIGDHLTATLDGTKVLDGRDPTFKSGFIGLQHHKDNTIEFRKILVKPLPNTMIARLGVGDGSHYHLLRTISIPGDYGWDYLTADSEGRRLYVSHDREVVVVDLESREILGKIPGNSIHGIAIARELGRGFISSGQPGSVIIFDLKTLGIIQEIPVGIDPNVILFDQKTQRVFTADRESKRVTAIDAKTGNVVGTIEGLGGKTEHAASDDAGHIFLNMQDLHTMLKLDSRSLEVLETWPMAPCQQPSSMDIDRVHERVFVGCRSGVMNVVDGKTGRIVTTQPIGKGVDAAEFDPGRALIYFSCGDGTMSVFHQDTPDSYTLIETVKTRSGARTMAIDLKTGWTYLSAADFGPRPESTAGAAQQRAPMIPGSFSVIIVGK